jgi:hypothetical protein
MAARVVVVVLACLVVFGVAGCGSKFGDGDGGGALSRADCSISACGGDLIGTWNVGAWCGMRSAPSFQLCDVMIDDSMLVETGTVTFGSDMTYTTNFQLTGTEFRIVPLPVYCNGVTYENCEDSCRSFSHGTGGPSADGKSCVCSEPVNESARATGTFTTTVSGGLTMTFSGSSDSSTYQYCVKGNELVIVGEGGSYLSAVFVRQ